MALDKVQSIWFDGSLVPWDDAQVHVLTHTLHYGLGAFEGIRAYKQNGGGSAVFRLPEHVSRLFKSCHICTIEVPFSEKAVVDACVTTLQHNKLEDAYLRPLVFIGAGGSFGLGALDNPIHVCIAAFTWGAYLGREGLERGIRAKVSSFRRPAVDALMSKGKICGHYVSSILAKREAAKQGYAEAIMLDQNGLVTEGSGENIFLIEGNVLYTTPTSSSILTGITRDSVLTIARDMGIDVRESVFTRDQLWCADEIFVTGTAAEVTPIREVDDRRIGNGSPGPITKKLQTAYFQAVHGETPRYAEWLTRV